MAVGTKRKSLKYPYLNRIMAWYSVVINNINNTCQISHEVHTLS